MMMSCVGFAVYKFSEPPLLAQQFFQSPPFGCLKIFGAPPQYLHPPPPLVILNELSLSGQNSNYEAVVTREEKRMFCTNVPMKPLELDLHNSCFVFFSTN